ncbi:MAG TPA: 4-(cytidine 5'-diphospho)-2-C-methyl-D-erythritol kinase [Acidobacteriaceae bacterium]|nr:4-(cytidine 5'-diphospho)-2-C-methyl-D-erythritol kinase [Acidobacteriaceae bacterium]
MATRIRSHAKINLGLAIGPPREDGYHGLATIYQTLAIHDFVEVAATPLKTGSASQITIRCNDKRVPCDGRNTCWKMIERALKRMNLAAQVSLSIEKRLPVQGGLGAGSANAAAALIGLEKELDAVLPDAERLGVAGEVGSDVPLFLVGGTVLGLGRGERVSALRDLPETPCVVAVPAVGVSTPQAFRDWDRFFGSAPETNPASAEGLTVPHGSVRLEQLGSTWASVLTGSQQSRTNTTGVFPSLLKKDRAENLLLELVRAGIVNDFEQVVFTQYPSLRGILETLKNDSDGKPAAMHAALSGSGSALFGLYGTMEEAGKAVKRLSGQGIRAFTTTTVGRQQYWQGMQNPD